MPDPDRGARSSRPLDKAGGGLQKYFLRFWPEFGLKIRGGPLPGSATVFCIQRTEQFSPNHFNRYLEVVKEGCAVLKTVT